MSKPQQKILKKTNGIDIQYGKLKIVSGEHPYDTHVTLDGKSLTDLFIISSLSFNVNTQNGKAKLELEYYDKQEEKKWEKYG